MLIGISSAKVMVTHMGMFGYSVKDIPCFVTIQVPLSVFKVWQLIRSVQNNLTWTDFGIGLLFSPLL